ncbi:hypothetical protein O1L44_04570 [Streptomyces noursei]|nr:hypothetical protein [Streptomyces noursei]
MAVLGQQVPDQLLQGAGEFGTSTTVEGPSGEGLGLVDVHAYRVRYQSQQFAVGGQIRRGAARRQFGFQRVPGGVQRHPQTAECGAEFGVRPAHRHDLLAVQRVIRGEGEQLDQGPGAGPGPARHERRAALARQPEPAEQANAQQWGIHEPDTLTRGELLCRIRELHPRYWPDLVPGQGTSSGVHPRERVNVVESARWPGDVR